jgi:hypothetical protein
MTYNTDEDYFGGEKKFEIHSHDHGMLVYAKPSVACSVIHDHNDCTPTF